MAGQPRHRLRSPAHQGAESQLRGTVPVAGNQRSAGEEVLQYQRPAIQGPWPQGQAARHDCGGTAAAAGHRRNAGEAAPCRH